jgi:hypothetical protein
MQPDYDLSKLIPEQKIRPFLNKEQQSILDSYVAARDHIENDTEKLAVLKSFVDKLSKEQLDFVQYWYKQQLCLISPLMICATEIAKISVDLNLRDKIALSPDGQSVFIIADNEDDAQDIAKKLQQIYPSLLINISQMEVQ